MRATATAFLLFALLPATVDARGMTPPPPPPTPLTEHQVLVPGQNVVIVSGDATLAIPPDTFVVELGVETEGKDIRAIVAENNEKVAALIAALKKMGVTSTELRTSDFRLASHDTEGFGLVYSVRNSVGVTRHALAQASAVVQTAIDAGATNIDGPQFSVADEKSVQDRCMEIAFQDAEHKAQNLSRLAKRPLGHVIAVTDGSSSPFELKHRSGIEMGVPGGIMFEPGVHMVECGVTVAFQLN
jgi:uncharacterized protein